MYIESLEQTEK